MFHRRLQSLRTVLFFVGEQKYYPFSSSSTSLYCYFDPKRSLLQTKHIEYSKCALVPSWKRCYEVDSFLRSPLLNVYQQRTSHYGQRRYIETSSTEKEKKTEKLSLFQRFKAMYRDYWYVLVPVHVVTSAVWYGSFYYMARVGVDIASLAEMAHFSDEMIEKIRKSSNSVAGHLAIAYLLYKVFTPLRYTVTLGGTTVSINYLKKWGWIKPMPKKAELRKMFDDKKIQLRKKRETLKERHELMKKTVMNKLNTKKRMKKTSEMVQRMLQRKKSIKRG